MIQENFYTGEPVITGSPPIFSQDVGSNMISESDRAAELASFGKYDYDAGSRAAYGQQMATHQAIYPGCYGYNNFGMQPMQPMYPMGGVGIGSYPYHYGAGNPVLQPTYDMYRQPQPYFQQLQHTGTVRIPGINLGGEFLPSITSEADITRMQSEYITKYEELQAKLDYERSNSVYGNGNWGGFNYYGTGYYNPYQYNSLNQEIYKQVEAMKDEARENRIQFNLNISKLAHNIARDGVTEEDIETRYRGKTVNIPESVVPPIQDYQQQLRYQQMVPFDNSQYYRDFDAEVSRKFHEVIPADAGLEETFKGMGILMSEWEIEEEMQRRKDGSVLYNSSNNVYKYFIRRKAQERYRNSNPLAQKIGQAFIDNSSLKSVATLADDGTLNVSLSLPCNVGSNKGEQYTVANSMEAQYDSKRERFSNFLSSIPGSIHLDEIKKKKLDNYSG